jgi:hypothetical protein
VSLTSLLCCPESDVLSVVKLPKSSQAGDKSRG